MASGADLRASERYDQIIVDRFDTTASQIHVAYGRLVGYATGRIVLAAPLAVPTWTVCLCVEADQSWSSKINGATSLIRWRFSLVVTRCNGLDQRSYSTLSPVSAWMGDRIRAGKLSRYVTSHRGQLSLAIPQWVSAMSTSLSWEVNRRSGVALATRQRQ